MPCRRCFKEDAGEEALYGVGAVEGDSERNPIPNPNPNPNPNWKETILFLSRERKNLRRGVSRFFQRHLSLAWATWRLLATELKRESRSIHGTVKRLRLRLLCRAFEKWQDTAMTSLIESRLMKRVHAMVRVGVGDRILGPEGFNGHSR